MGRRRTFITEREFRFLNKIDPSKCLSFILSGLPFIIMAIIFLCTDTGSIAVPILILVMGLGLLITGIILGIRYYSKKRSSEKDNSDYIEF